MASAVAYRIAEKPGIRQGVSGYQPVSALDGQRGVFRHPKAGRRAGRQDSLQRVAGRLLEDARKGKPEER